MCIEHTHIAVMLDVTIKITTASTMTAPMRLDIINRISRKLLALEPLPSSAVVFSVVVTNVLVLESSIVAL